MTAGALLPLLALQALDGRAVPFPEPSPGKPTVVVFVSTVCPVSNDYHARLTALWRRYERSSHFLVVYPNKTEPLEEVRAHAAAMRFPFPVWRDENNELADRAGARVTPQAAVFTSNAAAVDQPPAYLGPIDDAVNPARVKRPLLGDAIRAAIQGRKPMPSPIPAYG